MQSMGANMKKIYYANYTGISDVLVDGKKTGEKTKTYGTPTEYYINVSYQRGGIQREEYGINLDYTRALVTNDMSCPIEEKSLLWIEASASSKADYFVKRKSTSVNSISYEIEEVDLR